jgi:hypothetical protein
MKSPPMPDKMPLPTAAANSKVLTVAEPETFPPSTMPSKTAPGATVTRWA